MSGEDAITYPVETTSKIATSLDFLTHALCFISVLLIGADTWGINIGINLRLDQIFLTLLTLCLIINRGYRLRANYSLIAFLALTLLSSFFAFSVLRGFIFYLSIVYNTFLIFYCFSSYITMYGLNKLINIARKTIYIQAIIIIIQFVLKVTVGLSIPIFRDYGYYFGIPRFCIWFYEPSFFANYFVFWSAFAFYNLFVNKNRDFLLDVVLCTIAIFLSTSATGYIGFALGLFVAYLIWISKDITSKKLMILLLVIALGIIAYFVFQNVFEVFIGRIFNSNLNSASGGRVEGWEESYNVYKENILLGVGPGNYGLYLGQDSGYVPSNVTLELMATTGIFGTIAFYLITIGQVFKVYRLNKNLNNNASHLLASLAFAIVIFTIILQVNQGYLRLYHWMFLGMIEGGYYYVKDKYSFNKKEEGQNQAEAL